MQPSSDNFLLLILVFVIALLAVAALAFIMGRKSVCRQRISDFELEDSVTPAHIRTGAHADAENEVVSYGDGLFPIKEPKTNKNNNKQNLLGRKLIK